MERTNPFIVISNIDTLLNRSLFIVAQSFSKYDVNSFNNLPKNLKVKLLKVFTKRGLVNDDNIDKFLNEDVRTLDFTDCPSISDIGLNKLKCKYLVKIDLNSNSSPRNSITFKGIAALLQSCPYLQIILLRKCAAIDDKCLLEIAKTCGVRLTNLNVAGCPLVTDEGLKYLGEYCKNLKAIDLKGTLISDIGVFNLMSKTVGETIEEIHIANCKQITDESIEAILNNSKAIKFLMFHSCPKVTDASRVALEDYSFNKSNQQFKHLTWTVY